MSYQRRHITEASTTTQPIDLIVAQMTMSSEVVTWRRLRHDCGCVGEEVVAVYCSDMSAATDDGCVRIQRLIGKVREVLGECDRNWPPSNVEPGVYSRDSQLPLRLARAEPKVVVIALFVAFFFAWCSKFPLPVYIIMGSLRTHML